MQIKGGKIYETILNQLSCAISGVSFCFFFCLFVFNVQFLKS